MYFVGRVRSGRLVGPLIITHDGKDHTCFVNTVAQG